MHITIMGHKLAIAFALTASAVSADFDPDAYPRHETCALCHGLFGVSRTAKFPHLAGQDPAYLEAQLKAFLAQERTNDGGQMAAIVTELLPGDIEQVVGWFSTQEPPMPDPDLGSEAGGDLFSDLGCLGCHSADAESGVPALTAQHSGYLQKQMRDFRDGNRTLPAAADLHRTLLKISDTQITDIADYLAAQERGS